MSWQATSSYFLHVDAKEKRNETVCTGLQHKRNLWTEDGEMKRYPVCARTCRRVSCKVCGLGEVILKERDYVRSTTGVHAIMIYRDCRDSKRPPFFFLVDSTTIRRLFVDPTS